MKRIIIFFALSLIGFSTVLTSCKKRREFKKESGQVSEDTKNIQAGIDDCVADANTAVSNNKTINGRVLQIAAIQTNVCGASVDTTQKSQGILTVTYDGTTVCDGRKKAGTVKITLVDFVNGKRWVDAGAVLQLDYTNFKVTRTSDNKSITFNGTNTITNVNGGNLVTLYLAWQTSLIRKVEGANLTAKFDDNTQATFNLSRKYTFTFSGNVLLCSGEGEGTSNGISSLENWGTTRDGDSFTSQVVNPVKWNSNCGWPKPLEGKLDIKVAAKDFDLITTFGVDASGNAVASGCPWGLKVEWTYNNHTGNKLYQYH